MTIQQTPQDQIVCPSCGVMNPPASRVCQNCMGSLVQPAPVPRQPAPAPVAPIRPAPSVDEERVTARPMGRRAFERSMRPSVRRRGPVGRFADNLRQIAQGRRLEEEAEQPWWYKPQVAALALAFMAMVGIHGDEVLDDIKD